jgi:hypothetical protein
MEEKVEEKEADVKSMDEDGKDAAEGGKEGDKDMELD